VTSATRLAARAAAETMDTVVVGKPTSTQAERIAAITYKIFRTFRIDGFFIQ